MASGYSDLSEIRKDNGAYGQFHKPPKINLISDQPRRESAVERQLVCNLAQTNMGQPTQQAQQQVKFEMGPDYGRGSQSYAQDGLVSPLGRQTGSGDGGAGNSIGYATTSANHYHGPNSSAGANMTSSSYTTSTTRTGDGAQLERDPVERLVRELAQKEAKLRREIAYMNQHQMNPWARPPQVRQPRQEPQARPMKGQQRWVRECPSSPALSRPTSRASSTRSNTELDLMEKTAKLLQDAEEIEHKQMRNQEILIESGARQRRDTSRSPTERVSDIHTAVIKVPRTEIDNKSPLPFAYDNFSTLGVRGNIASVGAAPPDCPYPPIFPVVKRTPSPTKRMQ